ncbi:MAG: polyisoprenoid-binding protein [Myxococcales bacterium]|nr:MAG: polyisoprenoid-binding protein [Myxococcales bacterium]
MVLPAAAAAKEFKVDATHTTVGFSVRHLFTSVEGRFDKFEGEIEFDPAQPEKTEVEGSIEVKSINTNNEKRDKHLLSNDFFAAEEHPLIEFSGAKVSDVSTDKKKGKLHGTLKIRGNEKPIVLDVEFLGEGSDPWGNKKAGFSATGVLDRKAFGLEWNEKLETGGVLVGDEVTIRLQVEANVDEN